MQNSGIFQLPATSRMCLERSFALNTIYTERVRNAAMDRFVMYSLLFLGVITSGGRADGVQAESVPRVSVPEQQFDDILKKYPDLTFQQLLAETPKRDYIERLSFDPSTIQFYDQAVKELQL